MDSKQEDKLGMFLKTESFYEDHALDLAINPAHAGIKTLITAKIESAIQADSTATRNLTGLTTDKNNKRALVVTAILTVGAAVRGYYTTNPDPYKKALVKFTVTDINRERDTELIKKADQVHDVAEPIKALLAPWGVSSADVDAMLTLVNSYRPALVKGTREIDISSVAGIQVDKIFDDLDTVLHEQADDQMAVYEFTNNALYLEYKLARAIDDSGGNSGTDGYNVTTVVVPSGGSVTIPSDGPLNGDMELYFRAINGSVLVCSTNLPAIPCAAGYALIQGVTFKDKLSALGVDLTKQTLQLTNNGLTPVKVRLGEKI